MGRTVYFFSDHPFDLVGYVGITRIIRAEAPELRCELILDGHPYFRGLDLDYFLRAFDRVLRVGHCEYRRNLVRGFVDALRFRNDLSRLNLEPGSSIFLQSGKQLVSNILMEVLGRSNHVVYITRRDREESVADCRKNRSNSALRNLYHRLFGGSPVDAYAVGGGRWAEIVKYRRDPYEQTFYMEHAYGHPQLAENEIYYPFYYPEPGRNHGDRGKVVFFGSRFAGWGFVEVPVFAERLSRLLQTIRECHPGCELIYKPHPLETEEQRLLDLTGYRVATAQTAEMMFASDPAVQYAYSIGSTAGQTAPYFGIRSFLLYRLLGLPAAELSRFEAYFEGLPPEIILDSAQQIRSAGRLPPPPDTAPQVRDSLVQMLTRVGILR